MKIYQILPNLYLGQILEVADDTAGIPIGFTRTPIDVPENKYAVWSSTHWTVVDEPPPVIDPVVDEVAPPQGDPITP